MMVLGVLLLMFVLPRLFAFNGPAPAAAADDDKRKNADVFDKPKNEEYLDTPKRDDEYIVGADGEVMEVIDEDDPNPRGPVISG